MEPIVSHRSSAQWVENATTLLVKKCCPRGSELLSMPFQAINRCLMASVC